MQKNISKTLHNFLIISLGNLIYTVAVAFFILPNNLITGGTTGLALFGQYMFHIPITAFVYVFNIAMFLLGAWVLGKAFALTTILSTFEYPFFLSILQLLSSRVGPLTDDRMLATLFAGAGIGIGLGLVIQAGASTGGMDIPPLSLRKSIGFPVSVSLYLFDFCITHPADFHFGQRTSALRHPSGCSLHRYPGSPAHQRQTSDSAEDHQSGVSAN